MLKFCENKLKCFIYRIVNSKNIKEIYSREYKKDGEKIFNKDQKPLKCLRDIILKKKLSFCNGDKFRYPHTSIEYKILLECCLEELKKIVIENNELEMINEAYEQNKKEIKSDKKKRVNMKKPGF